MANAPESGRRDLDGPIKANYCFSVKNITVSVDDALYHAARVAAAQRQTNVTALLRGYLTAFVKGKAPALNEPQEAEDRKNREELVKLFEQSNLVLGFEPSREKTYER